MILDYRLDSVLLSRLYHLLQAILSILLLDVQHIVPQLSPYLLSLILPLSQVLKLFGVPLLSQGVSVRYLSLTLSPFSYLFSLLCQLSILSLSISLSLSLLSPRSPLLSILSNFLCSLYSHYSRY